MGKLDKEMETFQRELPRLLGDPLYHGMFVLIHKETIANVYPTLEAALSAGYEKFNLESFLVKQVIEREPPKYFSRNLRCPS
jgi:hypothetical protein